MPRVLNKYRDVIPKEAVYVGRGSKWGNPFKISPAMDRQKVVELYCEWVIEQPHLMAALHEICGKDLVCFCAPSLCHADVLIELAN